MILNARIGNALRHQCNDRDDRPGLQIQIPVIPVLSKEHIIIKMRELRRKAAELVSACCLNDLSHIKPPALQIFVIETLDLIEGDHFKIIIQIRVNGIRNYHKFFVIRILTVLHHILIGILREIA